MVIYYSHPILLANVDSFIVILCFVNSAFRLQTEVFLRGVHIYGDNLAAVSFLTKQSPKDSSRLRFTKSAFMNDPAVH